MTNELAIWCRKYDFNDDVKKHIGDLEKTYKQIIELEKCKTTKEQMTMAEWIFNHTHIEQLSCFSDRDKFLYGLGLLSNELANRSNIYLMSYLTDN